MILFTGSARIVAEHRTEALRLGIEHSVRSRAEAGCIAHNCHVDAEDRKRIVFFEQWADLAGVKAHFAVPASGEFARTLTAMAAEPPEMKLYDASELPRP